MSPEDNLAAKKAIIDDLANLVFNAGPTQRDFADSFSRFREIQNRWRETGPVPPESARAINDTYQLYVEKFYDLVQINRELRDMDFQKNREVKTSLCEQAEALAQRDDIIEAFKELQTLHTRWKECGPVAKEFRDKLWERFCSATVVINRKYQRHFEEVRDRNLETLTKLCEQAEALAESSDVAEAYRELQKLHAQWKNTGLVAKQSRDSLWERFRKATAVINHKYQALRKEKAAAGKQPSRRTDSSLNSNAVQPHKKDGGQDVVPSEPIAEPQINPESFFSEKALKLMKGKDDK